MEDRHSIVQEAALNILPSIIDGVISYGKETIKGLILLNSGSAAALLAFIGHLAVSGMKDGAKAFALPLCLFIAASIVALLGMGLSYISEIFNSLVCQSLIVNNVHGIYFKLMLNIGFMLLAIIANIASFGICGYAVWTAYFAFMSL